jgi:hypothetical protein
MPRLQTPVVMVVLPTPAVAELFVFASLAALTAGQRRSVGDDTSEVLRLRLAGLWEDHGLVFPSGAGTPISGGNLNRAF